MRPQPRTQKRRRLPCGRSLARGPHMGSLRQWRRLETLKATTTTGADGPRAFGGPRAFQARTLTLEESMKRTHVLLAAVLATAAATTAFTSSAGGAAARS